MFPLGSRGERPVFFPATWAEEALAIPGAIYVPGGVRTTWDAAPFVAARLGVDSPTPPFVTHPPAALLRSLPGLTEYDALGLRTTLREYQKTGAAFLAVRAAALLADDMRLGKCLTALAAGVLAGCRRILVVCPAQPKLGWAFEVGRWLKSEALLLEGRAATQARRFCLACEGRGRVGGETCVACRKRNGQADGFRIVKDAAPELNDARVVICNYDLLMPQTTKDERGKVYVREDLPGWISVLGARHWDLIIADESHTLRGDPVKGRANGRSRRELFNRLADQSPRVWLLTGTPQFGLVRHWWGQLDAMTRGAMTGDSRRLPFAFQVHYCGARKSEYGWWADGETPEASTELPRRLAYYMLGRKKTDVMKELPEKTRQIVYLDVDVSAASTRRVLSGKETAQSKTSKLMLASARAKLPHVVDALMPELAARNKLMLVAFSPDVVALYVKEIATRANSREWRGAVDGLEIWQATGAVSAEARFKMARAFREHDGPGLFAMTIDAVQTGISLKGATSEHWIDVHHDPAAMLQAEDRPYEPGITRGLDIVYYVARGSIDEHRVDLVLPKLESLVRVMSDKSAGSIAETFRGRIHEDTLDEALKRLAAQVLQDLEDEE